jgi:undecaprenyl-diphosphatase
VTLPIAVAAGGWAVLAVLVAVAVAAVLAGRGQLTADPARRRRFRRVLSLLVVAPAAVFTAVAGVVVAQGTPAWDMTVLRQLARHQQPTARAITAAATLTGSVPVVLVLLLTALVVLLIARLYRQAAFVAAATLLSMAASGIMKLVFARARPEVIAQKPGGWSFPSGHTMSATGFAVALVIVLWPTRWRRPALAVATVYAVGIGLTRLYLGVHYPSDVVAGWALALAVVGVTWLAFWDRFEPAPEAPAQDRGDRLRRAQRDSGQHDGSGKGRT